MHTYTRLVYASTSTSKPADIRSDLNHIIGEAQRFNGQHNICGVLYYGNGFFFQCVEGSRADVANLYEKLLKDPRHKDVNLLKLEEVDSLCFSNWHMKYVRHDALVQQFFNSRQWEGFYPYALDAQLIDSFIDLLLQGEAYAGFNQFRQERAEASRIPPWSPLVLAGIGSGLLLLAGYMVLGGW